MTRFSIALKCGCIVLPENGSGLDRAIEETWNGQPFPSITCVIHGPSKIAAAVRLGTGAHIAYPVVTA